MKIPFVEDIPKFEPRSRLGIRRNMTEEQREILDAIDVIEQKADAGLKLGVKAYNMGLILAVALIFVLLILLKNPALVKTFVSGLLGQ